MRGFNRLYVISTHRLLALLNAVIKSKREREIGRGNLRGLKERRREDEFNGDAVQSDYSGLYFVL